MNAAGDRYVIALHGCAAIPDHLDSHSVALGDVLARIPAYAANETCGLVVRNGNRRKGQLPQRRLMLVECD